jgi:hypothetical protein
MEEPKMTEEPQEQRQKEEQDERRMTDEKLRAYTAGRAIVLQVLRDDHEEWWTRAELLKEVDDIDPAIVNAELLRLASEGAVLIDRERVKASPCAQCMDALGLWRSDARRERGSGWHRHPTRTRSPTRSTGLRCGGRSFCSTPGRRRGPACDPRGTTRRRAARWSELRGCVAGRAYRSGERGQLGA